MSTWETYPADYRGKEVQRLLRAARAGECAAIVGLSGAGKSNLMGFIANRPDVFAHPSALVDCNRLREQSAAGLFRLARRALGDSSAAGDDLEALDGLVEQRLAENDGKLSLLLDRFEALVDDVAVASNLRALRDAHKYQLTFITATRRPLPPTSELAELSFGQTLWLGPLSESEARWNVQRYAGRLGQEWGDQVSEQMFALTWGYPSLLRAVCEAYAGGAKLEMADLRDHPAVHRRVQEFWEDAPSTSDLRHSHVEGLPLLEPAAGPRVFETSDLTEKEFLLLKYLQAHPGEVCSKDDLVHAVWPEDVIFARGIRDDSLAQVVRRLRLKIETDPSNPRHIQTVPGRGYLFSPE